ncbi:ETS-like protein pointed isoform X1 [Leptopilina heterotoma]|uniref:ETS-like protein pointed isoform X1 n=1 Tax=Leptopilina heterotoma TaxID=63436 RepID=UPI001CA9303E|nr:ETS-like protein pointed isoform X1 [Leptopilina heterotoma]
MAEKKLKKAFLNIVLQSWDRFEDIILTQEFFEKRESKSVASILGCGNGGGGSGVMLMMAKYMKQELTSDAEEEGLVPTLPARFTSIRKVPSLSDLSDQESSLGKCNNVDLIDFLSADNRRRQTVDIPTQVPPLTPGTNKKMTEALKASFASWEKEQIRLNITKGKK